MDECMSEYEVEIFLQLYKMKTLKCSYFVSGWFGQAGCLWFVVHPAVVSSSMTSSCRSEPWPLTTLGSGDTVKDQEQESCWQKFEKELQTAVFITFK